ncbi:MAG: glutamine-hydrolyzing carbamoyl-phosphate synthase small subunit [Bdellovibrionia bacterium]
MGSTTLQEEPGVLLLEDGTEFSGILRGASVSLESITQSRTPHCQKNPADRGYGEVVFNTSMTGYQEILTDPSYYGQIVCLTYPHIGNTGVNPEDVESLKPWCAGLIVHELCHEPSNWRSQGTLEAYLREHQIPALSAVDTRALTRHLRSQGVTRGVILPARQKTLGLAHLQSLPQMEGRDLIREVSTQKPYFWSKSQASLYRVVALDFGIKWNLLRKLQALGCDVEVLPAHSTAQEILERKPHGLFLSNGPGDPSAAPYAVQTIQHLVGKIPIFGVCMGHQLLALALGGKTVKLKFGHRGSNQPVFDVTTQKVEISSHNHGYTVDAQSLPPGVQVTHLNLNDQTVEGLQVLGTSHAPAFSVQYHPESSPGPHDSVALFSRFIENVKTYVSKIP